MVMQIHTKNRIVDIEDRGAVGQRAQTSSYKMKLWRSNEQLLPLYM